MASAALSCMALLALVLIPVALYLAKRLRPSVGIAETHLSLCAAALPPALVALVALPPLTALPAVKAHKGRHSAPWWWRSCRAASRRCCPKGQVASPAPARPPPHPRRVSPGRGSGRAAASVSAVRATPA